MTISIQVPKLPIETPEDHKAVLARIDALMDAEAGSDEAVELAVLGMLCAQTVGAGRLVRSLNIVSWEEACELNPALARA